MIESNVSSLLEKIGPQNPFGEKITLVAATKTRSPEEINRAIAAGITDIGENKVQEFRDKFDLISGARRHFIGRLQLNKVKYLIGKTFLIHSVDRDQLAQEISSRSMGAELVSDVLLEVNIGEEASKGGYPFDEALPALRNLRELPGICVKGYMAMLPVSDDIRYLSSLCKKMRALFEKTRDLDPNIQYLSMGMSADWQLCVQNGANMIRLGTAIFGERAYPNL